MATSIAACARLLARHGLRHHVDFEQGVIRLVFVTRAYRNLRSEKLVVVGLETPDEGRRVRTFIARAFACEERNLAATCLALCRLAADTPLVSVEFDAEQADLRLVVETVVDDRTLSRRQLAAMIDQLVEAAEAWSSLLVSLRDRGGEGSPLATQNRGVA